MQRTGEEPASRRTPFRPVVLQATPVDAIVPVAEQILPALLAPYERTWSADIGNKLLLMLANTEGVIASLQALRVPLGKSLGASFDHDLMISLDARCRLAARILDSVGSESELSPHQRVNLGRLLHELPQAALRLVGFGFSVYPAVAVALFGAAGIATLYRQGPLLRSTLESCRSYFAECIDPGHDGSLADNAEVRATAASNLRYAMEGMPKFGFLAQAQVADAAPSVAWRSTYGVISGSADTGYTGRVETETADHPNPRGWPRFPGFGDAGASLEPIVAYLNDLRLEQVVDLEEERVLRHHCNVIAALVREIDGVLARV